MFTSHSDWMDWVRAGDATPRWKVVNYKAMSRIVPRCAICEQRITQGQKFGALGTEAVHTDCARAGGLTVGQRKDQLIADARVELERAGRFAEQATVQAEKAVRNAEDLAIATVKTVSADRDRALAESAALRQENAQLAGQLNALRTALRNARLQRDSTSPPESLAETRDKRNAADPADHRDATEVRFSLLELDTGKTLG